jgi:hypothetical protein
MANYRVSTNTNSNKTTHDKTNNKRDNKTKQKQMDHLRFFTLKYDLLKIFVYLQTAFASETHLAEGQWLKEQLNVLKLRMFRVATLMPTVSRTDGHCLVPLKTFIENCASK